MKFIPDFIREIICRATNCICVVRQRMEEDEPNVMWCCPGCGCDRGSDTDPVTYEDMLCGGCLADLKERRDG